MVVQLDYSSKQATCNFRLGKHKTMQAIHACAQISIQIKQTATVAGRRRMCQQHKAQKRARATNACGCQAGTTVVQGGINTGSCLHAVTPKVCRVQQITAQPHVHADPTTMQLQTSTMLSLCDLHAKAPSIYTAATHAISYYRQSGHAQEDATCNHRNCGVGLLCTASWGRHARHCRLPTSS